jgi:hypothetical protein
MPDRFHSPRLTFKRAKHHIRDFERIVTEFKDGQPWTYAIDKESNPVEHIHKIKFQREVPVELSCILFDATNNLRAVLDQCGYAASTAAGRPTKHIAFPFSNCQANFANRVTGGCKDLPPEIRDIFEGFKGYLGGDNTLWAINEIANAKKHLALIPLEIGAARATVYLEVQHSMGTTRISNFQNDALGWDAAKNEMIVAFTPPVHSIEMRGHFTFDIAIDGIEVLRGQPAVSALNAMSDIVHRVLMATEAECRRLGFIS